MAAKEVILKLSPKLLAHFKTIELRRHLHDEFSKVPYELSRGDQEKTLNDLVFLLESPLFLYTIAPRLRAATRHFHITGPEYISQNPSEPGWEARNLSIVVGEDENSYFAQLWYGEVVLIDVHSSCKQNSNSEQCLEWLCEEVEFLAYEFRARELAAADILARMTQKRRSRIVKLKIRKTNLDTGKSMKHGNAKKGMRLKLTLRLCGETIPNRRSLRVRRRS